MTNVANCPLCGKKPYVYDNRATCCGFTVRRDDFITFWNMYVAAMNHARALRTLENAMEPLNSGKLKMSAALPTIRLAMTDEKACEVRVLEVFK